MIETFLEINYKNKYRNILFKKLYYFYVKIYMYQQFHPCNINNFINNNFFTIPVTFLKSDNDVANIQRKILSNGNLNKSQADHLISDVPEVNRREK